jgi:small GTP-binding protein
MFINYSSKQVTAKIVYYGPGLSGKTTNLQYIFSVTNPKSRGELVSIETEIERTLFFDLLPLNVGLVNGYQTKFQLYTVPGQIFYDATRKLVLKGVDGIVFVADSQELMEDSNIESLENLKTNLTAQGKNFSEIPIVFQFNKRDLKNISSTERLNKILNRRNHLFHEAIAKKGNGVIETLKDISGITLKKIRKLIDEAERKNQEKPAIVFDTNENNEIMDLEELPLKKIQIDNIDHLDKEISIQEDLVVSEPPRLEKLGKESEEIILLKKSLNREKIAEILGHFEDESRLTILKKIPRKSKIFIPIKDTDSEILESVDLELNPKVKKITLILELQD